MAEAASRAPMPPEKSEMSIFLSTNMAKHKGGKRRSQNKVLDAFQLAEKAAGRGKANVSDNEDSDLRIADGVMDARKFLKDQDYLDLEDEELDSDEALGSEDEYDVLNSKFSQTIRDGNEDDEGYSSIDELELVTLSQAWDMDDADSRSTGKKNDIVLDEAESGSEEESEEESESEESESEESEEESDSDSDIFGQDDEEVDLTAVSAAVRAKMPRQSHHKKLVSETTAENEFSVPTRGAKLSLAEMMGVAEAEAPLVSEAPALAVPLPKRIQQRHDRKAAYEITKKEVSRWQATVKALGEADHLEFPLAPVGPGDEEEEMDAEDQVEALRFVSETKEKSALEEKVNSVLAAGALLDESKEATFEQIAAAKLSKEDMFKRTQELRRMRELMFRDEQRARRIKKIKSKQFRKIRKRERLRDAELMDEAGLDESGSDAEDHDMKRAEERMSLRHKTQSKWAKSMIRAGITKDASTRAELEEMLRTGEKLRTKQLGYENGDQSDSGVSDIEKEYEQDEDDLEERTKLGKGVLAMDFMKAAEERKRKENMREIQLLRDTDGFSVEEKTSINVLKNAGRRVYSPSVAAEKEEMEEVEEDVLADLRDDEERNLTNQMKKGKKEKENEDEDEDEQTSRLETEEFTGFDDSDSETEVHVGSQSQSLSGKSGNSGKSANSRAYKSDSLSRKRSHSDDEENPWLAETETTAKSNKFHTITDESSRMAKAGNKIAKHAKKGKKSADTFIDTDAVLEMSGDVHDDDNAMFRQQNLIEEAFAGDDVMAEFEEEKQAVIENEGDKIQDLTLPGWGDWAGSEKPRAPKKKIVRKIDGVVQKDKRRDKDLKNVIINESVNKKNLRYQSASVPYPYKLKEEYERALRMPLGEEWTSRATHQRSTLPRVIVKQGVVVDPLKMPFK